MAQKRMFTMKIVDSDEFLDMPASTQNLYFHLNMRADDDGFLNNPKRIMRDVHATEDDLRLLLAKRFLIAFDDGVIVIKHWRMHNTIQKDRYTPTQYQEELAMLGIKDNKSYTLNDGNNMYTKCFQNVSTDIDIDSDIDKDLDIDIDKGLSITVSTDTVCRTDVQRVIESWNTLSSVGISQISKLTAGTKRYKSLVARIKEYGCESVMDAVDNIRNSPFLQGKNNRGWTITFDWFVLPNNFVKVLEGNYLEKANTTDTTNPFLQMLGEQND